MEMLVSDLLIHFSRQCQYGNFQLQRHSLFSKMPEKTSLEVAFEFRIEHSACLF